MRRVFRFLFVSGMAACACLSSGYAQATSASSASGESLSSWRHIENLPARTRVHITLDSGGTTCRVFSANQDALTCASGKSAGKVIPRSAIKRIKLTRTGVSTAAGFFIGAGAGAGIGAGVSQPGGWFRGDVIALFALGAGLGGAALGAGTDFARGPTIYVRP